MIESLYANINKINDDKVKHYEKFSNVLLVLSALSNKIDEIQQTHNKFEKEMFKTQIASFGDDFFKTIKFVIEECELDRILAKDKKLFVNSDDEDLLKMAKIYLKKIKLFRCQNR